MFGSLVDRTQRRAHDKKGSFIPLRGEPPFTFPTADPTSHKRNSVEAKQNGHPTQMFMVQGGKGDRARGGLTGSTKSLIGRIQRDRLTLQKLNLNVARQFVAYWG